VKCLIENFNEMTGAFLGRVERNVLGKMSRLCFRHFWQFKFMFLGIEWNVLTINIAKW
jgi:hypothetical protein